MSMVNAPPRPEVLIGWMQYGAITGARSHTRGRLWLFVAPHDHNAPLAVRIAYNHPQSGQCTYEDLGPAKTVRLTGAAMAEVELGDGSSVSLVTAPCVCGAGAVGYAAPGPDHPRVAGVVDLRDHPSVTVL